MALEIFSSCKRKSVRCACSVILVQIYASDDIASGRGFVARLQISIKIKLSQFGGRMTLREPVLHMAWHEPLYR
jgi:hypothetical protein